MISGLADNKYPERLDYTKAHEWRGGDSTAALEP